MAYSSKSLTSTQQYFAQIGIECLAIVEAVNKFDQWLLRKSDITDHLPFQLILQNDLASAPKRLRNILLQWYNFTVVYGKGSSPHLENTLSRAPCQDNATMSSMPDTFQVFCSHLAHLDLTLPSLTDETPEQLPRATASCQEMQSLAHYIIHGWPPTRDYQPQQPNILALSRVSQTASFWKPLRPLSLPCWPWSIIHIGVPNTAFVLQETPSSGLVCPRTLKNSATHAQLVPKTESKPPLSQCNHIPLQHFHGNSFLKIYLCSDTHSI